MRNSKLIVITRRLLTPDKIPGINIAAWFSTMESGSVILDGTTASQWSDISGNNRHATQATKAKQPTYTPDGLNGKPVLTFDGANDSLYFQGVHDAQWSIATVGRANGASQAFVQFGGVNDLGSLFTEGTYRARPTTGVSDASAPFTLGENVILSATYGVSTTDIWKNGVIGTPASVGGVASNALSTIGSLQNIYFLNGFISEMVVTNGILSTTDRQQLEGYLAWRRGLQANLVNNHPFKFSPPYI
ncbi:MAG: hypothetical protein ACK5V6_11465 [Pseudanabaena sp.]